MSDPFIAIARSALSLSSHPCIAHPCEGVEPQLGPQYRCADGSTLKEEDEDEDPADF